MWDCGDDSRSKHHAFCLLKPRLELECQCKGLGVIQAGMGQSLTPCLCVWWLVSPWLSLEWPKRQDSERAYGDYLDCGGRTHPPWVAPFPMSCVSKGRAKWWHAFIVLGFLVMGTIFFLSPVYFLKCDGCKLPVPWFLYHDGCTPCTVS